MIAMRRRKHRQWARRGFTLIELLTAIAIILILLSIAFPSYLAARQRGLVAAQKASLESVVTAIEAYLLDQKNLPPSRYYCFAVEPEMIERYYEMPMELTTPVKYLARRPIDLFNREGATTSEGAQVVKYRSMGFGFFNGMPTIEGIWTPTAFPLDNRDYVYYHENSKEHPDWKSPVKYGVWSVGIDHDSMDLTAHYRDPVPAGRWYSPTNGTWSHGVIARLSSGHKSP